MEKQYTIYFEIFGKKMKVKIFAKNKEEAKQKVKDKIVFHKIELPKIELPKYYDLMNNIFDILNGKAR